MKLTKEYIKDNYLILIIKISIICLFIFSLIYGVSGTINHFNSVRDYTTNGFNKYFQIATNNYYLRPTSILLIPTIGTFINKKIGWILIQSYFYFLISNLVFPAIEIGLIDSTLVFINVIGFIFLLLIIILMNKMKISNHNYGIEKKELINKNIIASVIGISITIILAMIKGNEV